MADRYKVTLSDGRKVTVEADHQPTLEEVMGALDAGGGQSVTRYTPGELQSDFANRATDEGGNPLKKDSVVIAGLQGAARPGVDTETGQSKDTIGKIGDLLSLVIPSQLVEGGTNFVRGMKRAATVAGESGGGVGKIGKTLAKGGFLDVGRSDPRVADMIDPTLKVPRLKILGHPFGETEVPNPNFVENSGGAGRASGAPAPALQSEQMPDLPLWRQQELMDQGGQSAAPIQGGRTGIPRMIEKPPTPAPGSVPSAIRKGNAPKSLQDSIMEALGNLMGGGEAPAAEAPTGVPPGGAQAALDTDRMLKERAAYRGAAVSGKAPVPSTSEVYRGDPHQALAQTAADAPPPSPVTIPNAPRLGGKAPTLEEAIMEALQSGEADSPSTVTGPPSTVSATPHGKPAVGGQFYSPADELQQQYQRDLERMGNRPEGTGWNHDTGKPEPLAEPSYTERLRSTEPVDTEWHSGADPGSAEAQSAQRLHKVGGEMDARYKYLMDNPLASVLMGLLTGKTLTDQGKTLTGDGR